METLPQIETLPCDQCQAPIDIIDVFAWPWSALESSDLVDDCIDLLCPQCTRVRASADVHALLDQRLNAWYHQREWLGSPPGTLHVVEERIYGGHEQPAFVFPAILFQVYVDRWNRAWSPQVLTNGPPFLVTLAAHIQVDPETNFWASLRWSWQRPDHREDLALVGARPFTPAKARRLTAALKAFEEWRETRGRRPGTGQFRNEEAVSQGLRVAIRALRAAGQTATQETVGEYIAAQAKTRRSRIGDPLADPGRRVRQLCADHGLDWKELLREA